MKHFAKRVLSILLAVTMVVSLQPLSVAAHESGVTEAVTITNPLYPQVVTDGPIAVDYAAGEFLGYTASAATPEEAVELLRKAMVEKHSRIAITYVSAEKLGNKLAEDVFHNAYAHTGVDVEGDYLYWMWSNCTYRNSWKVVENGYLNELQYTIDYKITAEQERLLTEELRKVISSFDFKVTTTDYEKIKCIYDYITANVTYDNEHLYDIGYTMKYTAYNALMEKTALAQGFALLFYRMACQAGVDCRVINGKTAAQGHTWNIVALNNVYYNVDTTWDAGRTEYVHFLRGSNYFANRIADAMYLTEEFTAVFPIASSDYAPVAEHTHEEVVQKGMPVSCTNDGRSDTSYCGICYQIFVPLVVTPAYGHDYEETVVTEPDCVTEGLKSYVCRNDSAHDYTVAIPPKGHSYVEGVCFCGAVYNPFVDVAETDYFYAPVLWALNKGITSGVAADLFGPEKSCTRGQVVTFLWRAAGSPEPAAAENVFTDVAEEDYFYTAALWAAEQGITSGIGDGLFGPDNTCTRAQIVTFLWAAQGRPAPVGEGTAFEDVESGAYYAEAVQWAAEQEVTGGIGEGLFGPENTCLRGQVATFLYKVYAK